MSVLQAPTEVFYSYVHEDEALRNELEKHLSILHRQGLISSWHDRQVNPGIDWAKAINTHLETASLILLLVSSDFLASDYCYGIEMRRALSRHQANVAYVVPILLRPVVWKGAPFEHLRVLPTDARPVTMWPNQDEAFADIVAGIRLVIEGLPVHSASASLATLPAIWNVPYPRNPFFTGRDALLAYLSVALKSGQTTALSQPQAISGLGGIGKTQVAIEYAYRYRQDYQAVLWTLADTHESLVSGYVDMAGLLNLSVKDEQDQKTIVRAVKAWLQQKLGWLLILDNADDLTLVPEFIPSVFGGHILLTTRAQTTGKLARRVEVETMSQDLGALFLLRRASLIAPDAPLEQATASDDAQARKVTEELGGLPLALDQAGAYIETSQCGLSNYLQRYQTRRAFLLKWRGDLVDDHPEPVATTWSLSFEKVQQMCPAAGDLLCICAFLAADAIPEEIVTEGAFHLGARLQSVASDPFVLDEAISALGAYSLLRRDSVNKTFSIHRLVQAVVRDTMQASEVKLWVGHVLRAVHAVLPMVEHRRWPQWERVLLHAQTCIQWIGQDPLHLTDATKVLQQTGWYLMERARYAEAQLLLERVCAINERERGEMHLDTALSMNNLAMLYKAQGRYAEAEPLLMRAFEIYEQLLGVDHPDTALSLNNLALLYKIQGKYIEAEPLYRRALAIREQQLGADHLDTALSMNNLAMLYKAQRKYAEAEVLCRRALEIKEQQLRTNHPDTATSMNNLAGLYYAQGKHAEAESLYQGALTIREEQLGDDHPDTARSLNNLAMLYKVQGKYAEAESLYRRALLIDEKVYGSDHPDVATDLNNLAMLYKAQGRYSRAEPLIRRALEINEQRLGSDHPDTRIIRENYMALQHQLEDDALS